MRRVGMLSSGFQSDLKQGVFECVPFHIVSYLFLFVPKGALGPRVFSMVACMDTHWRAGG